MSVSPSAVPALTPDWSRLVGDSLRQNGTWHTFLKLLEARKAHPEDLGLRGYVEIVRNKIVADFLQHPKGTQMVPKLTSEFLTNFHQFNLSAQEGYLVSLIDGRLNLEKLLKVNPFDHFTTIFYLAKLQRENAITIPQ